MKASTPTIAYTTNIQVQEAYDIIVCGGGPAGFAAGISAARLGAKTLLLEASGALGGMATQGLVTSYDGMADGEKPLVGGIMKEILDTLYEKGFLPENINSSRWTKNYLHPTKIKPEECKIFFDTMAQESGLDVQFFSRAVDVQQDSDKRKAKSLIVSGIDGLRAYPCKAIIDCTGDATIAAIMGAPYHKALTDTEHVMPSTLCFTLCNVDESRVDNIKKRAKYAQEQGYLQGQDIHIIPSKIADGVFTYNAGHVFNFDASNPKELSQAMITGRKTAHEYVRFLRDCVPGYEHCELTATAPLMGVRESRRIIGECTLTKNDYISARHFHDQIGIFNKEPDQHVYLPTPEMAAAHIHERQHRICWLPPGHSYGIPYGIMVPQGGFENLWVAGRSASTDIFVHSSSRVMPSCSMMGEAAGAAAVQHIQSGEPAHSLDTEKLVRTLKNQGAILPQTDLKFEMTRGSGEQRPCTPVVRMSENDPHPPAMEAILNKPKKNPATRTEVDLELGKEILKNTSKQFYKNCCRSRFTDADEAIPILQGKIENATEDNLLDLAQELQSMIDVQCCQSSFEDDGCCRKLLT